jgi:flagellar biogenesis protein FliO
MKKTHAHNKTHLNIAEMFSKNIGILGLIVVILFFVVYMLVNNMNNLNNKVVELEVRDQKNTKMIEELKTSSPAKK